MSKSVTVRELKENNCDGGRCVQLNGVDSKGNEFKNETFFITHDDKILFDDGTPVECETDRLIIAIRNALK